MAIWDQTYYVGTDAREAGKLEGQIVADAWKSQESRIDKNGDGKLQYVMLEGEQVHQDSLIRTEYSVKTILNEGIVTEKLASGTGNWMRSPAYELMQEWIGQYGSEIEVVLSNNDEMAMGAIEALEENGMSGGNGPIVVGIDGTEDGLEKIIKGEMAGTVMNDARGQAESILGIACACAEGEDPKQEVPELKGANMCACLTPQLRLIMYKSLLIIRINRSMIGGMERRAIVMKTAYIHCTLLDGSEDMIPRRI